MFETFFTDFIMRFWKHFLGVLLRPTWEKKHALNASCIVVHVSGQTFLKTDVEVYSQGNAINIKTANLPTTVVRSFSLPMLDDMSTWIATD